jgi:uncharacterized protein DUF6249
MNSSTAQPVRRRYNRGAARLLVLGIALALASLVAFAPRIASVHAQDAASTPAAKTPAAAKSVTITDGKGNEARIEISDNDRAAKSADKPPSAAESSPGSDAGAADKTVRRGKRGRVTIDANGDYDSFDAFVHDRPGIAAMVFFVVAVVFFAPVLAIGLILWYRFRKARMLNETMLKLAEKGVVPPAEALGALTSGKPGATLQSTPIYEQARQIQRRAAWSDLRKGVLIGGVGLALTLYSILSDREPNGFGLVLLFVGLGFVVLWWFEERRLTPPGSPGSDTTGTPGGTPPTA